MSYRDLPLDMSRTPLTESTTAADVIDLILEPDAREAGCVGLMLCTEDDIGATPVVIDDVPPDTDPDTFAKVLRPLLDMVAEHGGSLVFGRGRPGTFLLTDGDRLWHQVVIDVCRERGVRLLGAYLATPTTVRPLPGSLDSAAAS